jgi:predicted ATP-grasp superfamily ATP-dependent carboligase
MKNTLPRRILQRFAYVRSLEDDVSRVKAELETLQEKTKKNEKVFKTGVYRSTVDRLNQALTTVYGGTKEICLEYVEYDPDGASLVISTGPNKKLGSEAIEYLIRELKIRGFGVIQITKNNTPQVMQTFRIVNLGGAA